MQDQTIASLELDIARQCAPVLMGVKPSNLLILERPEYHPERVFPKESGLSLRLFYQSEERSIWLVYRREELEQILEKAQNRLFLAKRGYPAETAERMLACLVQRYREYRENKKEFPHEMGIFLGYPLGDVEGFIAYSGQNYLYSGYWKVYENVEETKKQFQLFTAVKMSLIEALKNGMGLGEACDCELLQPV